MKKFLPIILLLALAGVGLAYYLYNKPHQETSGVKADVVITPADLLAAYEADESGSNAKYLDKIVAVEGKVRSINDVSQGGSISLDTGNEMSSIICEFEDGSVLADVAVGDIVKVKGFCTGFLMDIVLVRCSL
jgi:hypothetical protein